MERFNALGRGVQLMLIGGVLLFVDLLFAWQSIDLGPLGDYSRKGWYGAAGVIVGLLTIVLLAWLIVRLASVNIPLPVSTAMTAAIIGTLILIFTVIKLLTILGDEATIWAWVGLALAILVAVGSFMTVQEAGGVETLKTEASSLGSSGGAATAAPPAPPVAEATPTAPPPPPPAAEAAPSAEAAPEAAHESRPTTDTPSTEREE